MFMADIKVKFGKRLRKFRRNKDVTQEQLAELIGVSADFISQIERGLRSPSFENLQKLSEVLEVPLSEFFQFPEDK
jgi:transcriptional regulator with XRE-family HTH domain